MAERPGTSGSEGSRGAWKDPEQIYGDKDDNTPAPTPWSEKGEAPAAMESEVFDRDGTVRVQQRQNKHEHKGCWYKFSQGVRSMWMTKETEDTKHDRELYIRTTIRELVVYLVFLVVLCIVTFGMTTATMYYYTKVLTGLFLDTVTVKFPKSFIGITMMDDFWDFADEPLIDGLYWEEWYNGENVTDDQRLFIFFENKLLGLPRIRQVRVRNDSCIVPDAFAREIKECYSAYSEKSEEKRPFGLQNGTAWHYQSGKQLESGSQWGRVATYGGGGYVQDLPPGKKDARKILAKLKKNKWIDRGTRALFFDFTVYNANINLFSIVRLVLEFPPTGGVLPSWNFRTVKLIRYVTAFDYFVLACEGIFCAFIIYYMIEEGIEIVRHRCSYFKSFWNILDLLVLMLALTCIGFSVYRVIMVDQKLSNLLEFPDKFANFEFLSFAQTRYNDALAVMVFFAWVKIFKYISFNKTMNQLSSTLSRCAKDVGGFAVMFFIFFFAYAQLGYLIFGTQVKDFSTFYNAVFTLLRTILGDFDFNKLEQANRVLGPLFFISYVFFVFFVLLNMFLAIINDTYAEGYYSMLRKMNMGKKENIVDIQAALEGADADKNNTIDFEEWREHLKGRGYSEQEIEQMFQKYDSDGNRQLNREEQEQMKMDFQGHTMEDIDGDRNALDMDEAGSERPPTSRSKFEDFDSPSGGGGGFAAGGIGGTNRRGGVTQDEFNVLNKRVDRMEQSVGAVVGKIDAVLGKLDGMEKIKMRHREKIANLLHDVNNSNDTDNERLSQLGGGMKKELDRFESDSTDQ